MILKLKLKYRYVEYDEQLRRSVTKHIFKYIHVDMLHNLLQSLNTISFVLATEVPPHMVASGSPPVLTRRPRGTH